MRTPLCDLFGIEVPIFAFSPSKEVVAAVCRAGGMGVLGAVAYSVEQLERELCWIDAHVEGRPYGVDVVMPSSYMGAEVGGVDKGTLQSMLPERHMKFINDVLARYKVPPLPEGESAYESLLSWTHAVVRPQVDIALSHPIRLLANALGSPPADVIEKAHAKGVQVAALCGTVEHARRHVQAGVDIIIAQGYEAGGHTGEIGSMVLVPDVVDAVAPRPVLAAGGIGSGRQLAAALALGAQGGWTGSIWLTTQESATIPAVKEKLLRAGAGDTVRSRSMTGKPARMLRTAWTEAWEGPDSPGTLPMPLQFMITADAITRMHRYAEDERTGARELLGSAVGQIVGRMNESRPAGEVVRDLVEGFGEALERLEEIARR
jgi:NAD(P)H-dependent flavin oxidoreductase YrpB (nitropropane dioxygenase family)